VRASFDSMNERFDGASEEEVISPSINKKRENAYSFTTCFCRLLFGSV